MENAIGMCVLLMKIIHRKIRPEKLAISKKQRPNDEVSNMPKLKGNKTQSVNTRYKTKFSLNKDKLTKLPAKLTKRHRKQ
jgi:hypothetical protein